MLKFINKVFLFCICISSVMASDIDTNRIMDQVYQAYHLQEKYPDSSFQLARDIYEESKRINFKEGVAYSAFRIGTIYNLWGKNDSSAQYVKEANSIRLSNEDWLGASSTSLFLGIIYKELGKMDSAFSYFIASEKLVRQANDSVGWHRIVIESAHQYLDYGEVKKAKDYYNQALNLSLAMGNEELMGFSYSALGKYFFESNQYDSAMYYFKSSVDLFEQVDLPQQVLVNKNNLALCYSNTGRWAEATLIFKSTISAYKALKLREDLSLNYLNLGQTYLNRNMVDSAIHYLKNASFLSNTIKNLENESLALLYLSDAYQLKGEYETAMGYQKKHAVLKDSLLNAEKVRSISEMQTKYETQLKEQEIELLDEENKTKTAQRNALFVGILLLILSASALIFFFVQKNKISKQAKQIAEQKLNSVLDEQEINTYNAMLKGQEEERLRIANDLHDRLGSMLSTIKLMFSSLEDKIGQVQEENKTQMDKTTSLIDDACVEVRRISHNLGAGLIANYGLVNSLEDLTETINQTSKVDCKLLIYNMEEGLPLRFEVELYRIAQEILNNALKYANAKSITVQLSRLDEEFSMTIEDDGVGFDFARAKKKGGMGLANIEKRAAKLNGKVYIDTAINKGCISIIEIPLKQS